MDDAIDTTHPVFDRFEAAGYPTEGLIDPGNVTREDVETGRLRLVILKQHGIEAFDIDASDVREDDRSPAGVSVEFGNRGSMQPIAFAGQHGLLNDDIIPISQLKGRANAAVAFFYDTDVERTYPTLDEADAIRVLDYWGSEGWLPRGTAEAILDAFDGSLSDAVFQDDPDVAGEEIVRAPVVAKRAAVASDAPAKSSDSTITGHKKRRRQSFHRNLESLRDYYGVEPDE